MTHLETIIIGFILFIITSTVAYLFRMRQLYVAVPKLYRHAPISKNGSLCELIIYNKGNQVEEQIQVALDPDLKVELLASNSNEISIDGSTIKISRLHKGNEASAMLLIENGALESSKLLSVSSKATTGKILKRVTEVPPNYALTAVVIFLIIGILPAMIYSFKLFESLKSSYVKHQLSELHSSGWSNLDSYFSSDIKLSYSNQEFPIRIPTSDKNSRKDKIAFEIYNKTALPMNVFVDIEGTRSFLSPYFDNIEIAPMSKDTINIKNPLKDSELKSKNLEFSIKVGSEYLHGILFNTQTEN